MSITYRRIAAEAGFSLLEVIIATAILAASAMVLTSLLGLGSKYGNRAEERTRVASQAQSLLDEFIATASADTVAGDANELSERTGVLPGRPEHSYRLTAEPFVLEPFSGTSTAIPNSALDSPGSSQSPATTANLGLTLVRVQVFDSVDPRPDAAPLVEFSQLVRSSWLAPRSSTADDPTRDPFQLLE